MKNDAYSKLFPIIVGFHRQEPIPQQGKSAEDLLEYPSGRNMPSGTAGRVKECKFWPKQLGTFVLIEVYL